MFSINMDKNVLVPMEKIFKQFKVKGNLVSVNEYGNGYINDTFLVETKNGSNPEKYILQRINHKVFFDIEALMNNIEKVTSFVLGKYPDTVLQQIIKTNDNKNYFFDKINNAYWRVFSFVDDSVTHEYITDVNQFYEAGIAFGLLQRQLDDFDSSLLVETIKDFHHTEKRYQRFCEAVDRDLAQRTHLAVEEIKFLQSREHYASVVTDLIAAGKIPVRVTHNDTKLNNVLLNKRTGKALSVVDFDTIMPGSILYDFGDAIRYGASTAEEDETNLGKVSLDLVLFEAFTKGFLKHTAEILNEYELKYFAFSALLITYELSMRFLSDYLNGDIYFKIKNENHNLERTRAQIALLKDMENKLPKMEEIINRIYLLKMKKRD